MRRHVSVAVVLGIVVTLVMGTFVNDPSIAQDGADATISAQETKIVELEGTVAARGEKINAQRTTIAELRGSSEVESGPTKEAQAEAGTDATNIFGPGLELLPAGSQGEVEVVLQGVYDGNILPVVVRNNLGEAIGRVSVTASVRSASGDLISAGGDQGFNPTRVEPGSYALGYLYFDGAVLPPDATFEFNVTYSEPDSDFLSSLDLTVLEAAFLGDRIVGQFRNDHDVTVQGPIDISIVCLSADGSLLAHETGYTDQDVADPGETIPFQVSFFSGVDCSYFLLAASGYNF